MELVVESGQRRGERFSWAPGTHGLGRDPENAWVLPGKGISRKHAEVAVAADGTAVIRDLGSSNGTWINGLRCPQSALSWADTVVVGDSVLRVVRPGEAILRPLSPADPAEFLVGEEPCWQAMMSKAASLADEGAPLWIEGPVGSGRKTLARSLHRLSRRKYGPFAEVDLSKLNSEQQCAELLGSEERQGLLPLCERGGLVLVNAESLSPRAAEELAARLPASSARLVAVALPGFAENSPLRALFAQRLAVPSLAERPKDVVRVASYWLQFHAAGLVLSEAAKRALVAHLWPENVAELRMVIEAAALVAGEGPIEPEHFPEFRSTAPGDAPIVQDAVVEGMLDAPVLPLQEVIDRAIRRALQICNEDQKMAAEFLKISRQDLSGHIRRLRDKNPDSP